MSYDNLRKGRCSLHGQFYLVTAVAADRQPLFADFATARCAIAELRRTHDRGSVVSMAWVLMPDHLHWLFQLGEGFALASVMQGFKGRSAREIRRRGEHRQIWQRSYHDHALRAEENVQEVAHYLVANPLRAGLVQRAGDYPHWDAMWI
jgi:REP element-mobilizing transposase RayT